MQNMETAKGYATFYGVKRNVDPMISRPARVSIYENRGFCKVEQNPFDIILIRQAITRGDGEDGIMNTREDYISADGRKASWASKDGAWWITEFYAPTEQDRANYPKSYPPGSDGPFYKWAAEKYDSREEAIAAIEV